MKYKIRISILSLLPAIFLATILFPVCEAYYCDNHFFQFLHTSHTKGKVQNSDNMPHQIQKSIIFRIERPIDSVLLFEFLNFLQDAGAEKVILEANNNFISRYNHLDEINQLLASHPELFIETLPWKSGKSICRKNQDSTSSLFLSLRNRFPLAYAKQNQSQPLLFHAGKNQFCPYINNNRCPLDFLFRLDKKYLLSLPFALYLHSLHQEKLASLRFNRGNVQINGKFFYYDAQARFAFKSGFSSLPLPESISFKDIQPYLNDRKELPLLLERLKIPFSGNKEIDKTIQSLRSLKAFGDNEAADIENAKKQATLWKAFSQKYQNEIQDSLVFITTENDSWVPTVLGQLHQLKTGSSMHFLPTIISIFLSLIMFFLLFISVIWMKQLLPVILTFCTAVLGNLILYFFTANYWNLNYPLSGCIISLFIGLICGLSTKYCSQMLWQNEISQIFLRTISPALQKKIAQSSSENKLQFGSQIVETVFLQGKLFHTEEMDTNISPEDRLIYINEITNRIGTIIQENNGVLYSRNSDNILAYYSKLLTGNDFSNFAIFAVKQLLQCNFHKHLIIALHNTQAYFTLSQYLHGRNSTYMEYKPLGNFHLLLRAMLKFAEEFHVNIVVSGSFIKSTKKKQPVRMLDRIRIKGSTSTERLFEFLPIDEFRKKEKMIDYFHAGLKLFEQKKWEEAAEYFCHCLKLCKEDVPAAIYLQRCKDFLYIPPNNDWNGIYEID